MQRFDEIELEPVPMIEVLPATAPAGAPSIAKRPGIRDDAPRFRRLLALLTDISLLVALALALSPLLPLARDVVATLALGGYVLMISYYYFVGTWLLWGKSVGGAIFDVKIVGQSRAAMSLKAATLRWAGFYASLLTGGIGFAIAALPGRRSLADRLSHTRSIAA